MSGRIGCLIDRSTIDQHPVIDRENTEFDRTSLLNRFHCTLSSTLNIFVYMLPGTQVAQGRSQAAAPARRCSERPAAMGAPRGAAPCAPPPTPLFPPLALARCTGTPPSRCCMRTCISLRTARSQPSAARLLLSQQVRQQSHLRWCLLTTHCPATADSLATVLEGHISGRVYSTPLTKLPQNAGVDPWIL